jgi:hypothetical protein
MTVLAGVLCISTSTTPPTSRTSGARPGASVIGPEDSDYGKREGSHADRDGNLIRFGSPLRSTSG